MKKILLALVFCGLLTPWSCTKSKYAPIEESFKEYVANNFDDPSLLKHIVSIEPIDTFHVRDFKAICEDYLQSYNEANKVADSIRDEVMARMNSYPEGAIGRLPNANKLHILFLKGMDLIRQEADILGREDYVPLEIPQKVVEQKDTTIVSFCIKYRLKNGNSLIIDSVFATSDTLLNKISITKTRSTQYGQGITDFLNLVDKACTSWAARTDIKIEQIKCLNQMSDWLNSQE